MLVAADARAGHRAPVRSRAEPHGLRRRSRRSASRCSSRASPPQAIQETRATWRANISAVVLGILALTLIVSMPPLLRWRDRFRRSSTPHLKAIGIVLALLAAARLLLWFAPTARWTDQIFQTAALGPGLRALLRTPIDFLLTMALPRGRRRARLRSRRTAAAQRSGIASRRRRRATSGAIFAITQLGAGALVALLLVGYEVLLGNAIAATSVDALHFSLHPLVSARLAFAVGLILAQAVVFWAGIVVVLLMTLPWRMPRSGGVALAAFALQAIPVLIIAIFPRAIGAAPSTVPALPTAFAGLACLALAWAMAWARPRYRHASQALRLFAGALVLLIPAFVLYPSVHHFADRGLRRLIEEEYARQANDQRAELQQKLTTVLQQIDALDIPNLAAPPRAAADRIEPRVRCCGRTRTSPPSGWRLRWSSTAPDGGLASRFALNLPDYVSATQRWREPSCDWEIFEEASLVRIRGAARCSMPAAASAKATPTRRRAARSSST